MKTSMVINRIFRLATVSVAMAFSVVGTSSTYALVHFGNDNSAQDKKSVEKNEDSKNTIELVEEKDPRNSINPPISLVDGANYSPFTNSEQIQKDGFFYFTDSDKKGLTLELTPAPEHSVKLDGMLRAFSGNALLSSTDLHGLSSQGGLDLTLADGDSQNPVLDGFALSLKSAINLGMPELAISPETLGLENPLLERHYNLGISLGYAGFNLDANFQEKENGFNEGYTGVDVGLSYKSRKWITRVGLAEYTYNQGPYSMLPDSLKRLYSLELGGAYSVSPWLSLSGGLKVFDYGKGYTIEDERRSGQVYLGGRLSY